jgi:hypothetical protein
VGLASSTDYVLNDTDLHVTDERMDRDRWLTVLKTVAPTDRGRAWHVGDLLAFGEKKYGDGTYELAAEALDYDRIESVRNLAYVSRAVPPEVREPSLSHRTHRAVAAMNVDEQRRWLKLAAANGWRSTQLQREIDAASPSPPDETDGTDAEVVELPANENADFDAEQHWEAAGMPVYDPPDPPYKLVVSFESEQEREDFLASLGSPTIHQKNGRTSSIWWPDRPKDDVGSVEFVPEEVAA